MDNMNSYLRWRGDLSFDQAPVCAVDLLIFSQIIHAPFEKLRRISGKRLIDLAERLFPEPVPEKEGNLDWDRYYVWKTMPQYRRFAEVELERFSASLSAKQNCQFAAGLFSFGNRRFVIYRGTDSTLTGWKEDFNLGFEKPIPSQIRAAAFLKDAAAEQSDELFLAGHSKGGNLAMYAALSAPEDVRRKITECCSFDGPGLNLSLTETPAWQELSSRMTSFIPQSSIIGRLLGSLEHRMIVHSDNMSILQHDPFFWHVEGPKFVPADETTLSSEVICRTMQSYLRRCSEQERRTFVNLLFDLADASGASSLEDFPAGLAGHLDKVAEVLSGIPKEDGKVLQQVCGILMGEVGNHSQEVISDLLQRTFHLDSFAKNVFPAKKEEK